MFFKVGEQRPFLLGNTVHYGRILEVDEENGTYLMEDRTTKEQHTIYKYNVFIGDD